MNKVQKEVAEKLLQGYYLVKYGEHWFRLRSPQHVVVRKVTAKTFWLFRDLLRIKGNLYYINKNKVRQLHGRSWVKQLYKKNGKVEQSSV